MEKCCFLILCFFFVSCSESGTHSLVHTGSSIVSVKQGWTINNSPQTQGVNESSQTQINIHCGAPFGANFSKEIAYIPSGNLDIQIGFICNPRDKEYLDALKKIAERIDARQSWRMVSGGSQDERYMTDTELNILKGAKSRVISIGAGILKKQHDTHVAHILRSGSPAKYWEPIGVLANRAEQGKCWRLLMNKNASGNLVQAREMQLVADCFKDLPPPQ